MFNTHSEKSALRWQRMTLTFDGLLAAELVFAVVLGLLLIAPKFFGFYPYMVKTQSMTPAINAGDLVYVDQNFQGSRAQKGDIVAFPLASTDEICIHRVVGTTDDDEGVITKGDANGRADSTILARKDIDGQVRWIIPYLGFPCGWIVEHVLYGVGLIVFTGLLALSCAAKARKENELLERNPHGNLSNAFEQC